MSLAPVFMLLHVACASLRLYALISVLVVPALLFGYTQVHMYFFSQEDIAVIATTPTVMSASFFIV